MSLKAKEQNSLCLLIKQAAAGQAAATAGNPFTQLHRRQPTLAPPPEHPKN
jgi:hypothetical protein